MLYCTLSAATKNSFLLPMSCQPTGPRSQSAQMRYFTVWLTFLEKPTFSKWNMSTTSQCWVSWSPDGSDPMLYLSVMLGRKSCGGGRKGRREGGRGKGRKRKEGGRKIMDTGSGHCTVPLPHYSYLSLNQSAIPWPQHLTPAVPAHQEHTVLAFSCTLQRTKLEKTLRSGLGLVWQQCVGHISARSVFTAVRRVGTFCHFSLTFHLQRRDCWFSNYAWLVKG